MSPGDALVVLAGGFGAGLVNAVAGGGTLVSYPALLAAGLDPVTANTSSSVGLVAGFASGSLTYREELRGQRQRARGLLVAAVLGGLVGAALLLATPGDGFEAVVPYLVLVAAGLLAVQPRLAGWLASRGVVADHPGWEAQGLVALAAVYGTYFGAGLGVVLLAVLGLLVADGMQRLNALKGVIALVVNLVGAVVFVVTGRVDWPAVLLLAAGAVVGATVGVRLARRLPSSLVRSVVVLLGVVVAVTLLARG